MWMLQGLAGGGAVVLARSLVAQGIGDVHADGAVFEGCRNDVVHWPRCSGLGCARGSAPSQAASVAVLTFDVAAQFVIVAVVLSLVPGPDNLFVLMQSAISGVRSGLAVTLGLCTGLIVHTTAVAFGVAAVFAASAVAFTALKVIGAAYLLYLAWNAFRTSGARDRQASAVSGSFGALYLRGVVMNITNPKVAIFFLAFLPQFVHPSTGPVVPQIFQLGALFIVATWMVFSAVALLAGRLSGWLRRSERAIPVMNKLAGVVFVGLAAKLMTAQR